MAVTIKKLIACLKKRYPDAHIALHSASPWELLVATILSAQCTDERVNKVTAVLFKKYRSLRAYAEADLKEFEQDIRSTGFYHNKAKNIIASAQMVRREFGGNVPKTMDEILRLPGVARKTANVVLGNAYGVIEGIVVDTHVRRIAQLLGLTKNDDPVKIEQDLMKIVPRSEWLEFPYLLQALGRTVCTARRPVHTQCSLRAICPSAVR